VYASFLCVVLATRVVVGFHSFRAKLVQHEGLSPSGAVAHIDIPPGRTTAELAPPFAIIARVQNDFSAGVRLEIRVDGQVACARSVPANSTQRIDCVWRAEWAPQARHAIEVTGTGSWTLRYLELATHHGATRAYDLIVVPAEAHHYTRPSAFWIVLAFVAIAGALLLPMPRMPRWLSRLYALASAMVIALLLLVFASPHVSGYALLLSGLAFVELVGLLLAPRLSLAARRLWQHRDATVWSPAAKSLASAAVVLAVYGGFVSYALRHEYRGNYSGFLQISRLLFDRNPMLSTRSDVRNSLILQDAGGYDGQFMYFAAFDPFLRTFHGDPVKYRAFIDAPPYRFGRIGFSLLIKLFSGNRWQWYPATMVWLILASLFLCGLALSFIARHNGGSPAWGLVVILVPGFWQSIQTGLPESIAAALLLWGWCLLLERSTWAAGLLFALSLLVRETGAVLVVCAVCSSVLANRRRDGVELALLAFAPLLAWRLYVGWILMPDWGTEAFLFNAQNVGRPFAGILHLWSSIRQGDYFPGIPELSRAGICYPIILILGFGLAGMFALRRPGALAVAAVAYGLLAISLTYDSIWVHVGNGQRGTYELFIVLAMLSAGTARRPFRVAVATFWLATTMYTFFGAFDAQYVRDAVVQYDGIVYKSGTLP
jgi:hypothetical protein